MQEIKLNNCETKMRWKWERIQVKLFKIGIKGLALQQYQQLGAVFFNQTTNILISFIAARAVVQGDMTLGMMMSVTYIVGAALLTDRAIDRFLTIPTGREDQSGAARRDTREGGRGTGRRDKAECSSR